VTPAVSSLCPRLREKIEPDPENPMHTEDGARSGIPVRTPCGVTSSQNSDSPFSRCWSVLFARGGPTLRNALCAAILHERTAYSQLTGYSWNCTGPRVCAPSVASIPAGRLGQTEGVDGGDFRQPRALLRSSGNDGAGFLPTHSPTPRRWQNHAGPGRKFAKALAKGSGRSIRHSVTLKSRFAVLRARYDVPGATPVVLRFRSAD